MNQGRYSSNSDRSLLIDMEYMLFLSQNIELLNIKELELKAINYDRKHQRDQEYVNNKIQEHTNDLANMHKSELKVCEYFVNSNSKVPLSS